MDEVGKILASKLKDKTKSNLILAENLEHAIYFVYKEGKQDDVCLFSPAAKTPPPLKDFKERGAYFKNCIKKLFNEGS
jgi:UDP-N-acetylmuramoylalanine-D-glutamate ligase